jgi:predicted HTH domain antitoxin
VINLDRWVGVVGEEGVGERLGAVGVLKGQLSVIETFKYAMYYNVYMGETISFRLGKKLQIDLGKVEKKWQIDRSEVIRRLLVDALKEWKIQNALEGLSQRRISLGKAAEECDVSIWELLERIKQKNLDWTGYREEDIERDLKILG